MKWNSPWALSVPVIILAVLMVTVFMFISAPWPDEITEDAFTMGPTELRAKSLDDMNEAGMEAILTVQYGVEDQNGTFTVSLMTPERQNLSAHGKVTVAVYERIQGMKGDYVWTGSVDGLDMVRTEAAGYVVDRAEVIWDLEEVKDRDGTVWLWVDCHVDGVDGNVSRAVDLSGEAFLTLGGKGSQTSLLAGSIFDIYGPTFLFIGLLLFIAMIGGTFMSKIEEVDTRTGVEVFTVAEEDLDAAVPSEMPMERQVGSPESETEEIGRGGDVKEASEAANAADTVVEAEDGEVTE